MRLHTGGASINLALVNEHIEQDNRIIKIDANAVRDSGSSSERSIKDATAEKIRLVIMITTS